MLDCVLRLVEALAEGLPLFWQDEGIRDEVKVLPAEPVLHLLDVDCESVLPRQLLARRKVINLLVLVQPLVKVVFALCMRPQHVPIVTVCRHQTVNLEQEADQL